jgi:hypothetical protein
VAGHCLVVVAADPSACPHNVAHSLTAGDSSRNNQSHSSPRLPAAADGVSCWRTRVRTGNLATVAR